MNPFEVQLLGTNSALPAFGRHPTSQILSIQKYKYLIDCGEGTQMRFQKFGVKPGRMNQIFISHLHGDHFYGLIGLLTTLGLIGRKRPLDIFGPDGLEEIIRVQTKYAGGDPPFSIQFHTIDTEKHQLIFENNHITVHSIPLDHRVPTSGFLFREKPKERKMIGSKIEEYQIPFRAIPAIKKGADFTNADGQRIANALLTEDPSPPRSYAYCSDTRYKEDIIPLIEGADMLYHESTFQEDLVAKTIPTGHSTALQAAQIAKRAKVGRLILGHFSSRYENINSFAEEARTVFPEVVAGVEGEIYRPLASS
ncbi:MAG: ribonuclease Z [Saprospiraceae bacterium]|nr:ribonuclease Z [Saprospiraceae bacterium]